MERKSEDMSRRIGVLTGLRELTFSGVHRVQARSW